MNVIKRFWMLALLLCMPIAGYASSGAQLDRATVNLKDAESLQRGAKLFTSRCLACHSAASMRYNRLYDIGMDDDAIKVGLDLPDDVKVGDTMHAAMDINTAKMIYGVAPPDLSVISRSHGADWLYTYLRTFYADEERPTGWNNATFPGVGMPNVTMDLQGTLEMQDGKLVQTSEGSMTAAEFDAAMGDLVNYLVFMGEPAKMVRYDLGKYVLIFLGILLVLVYALKKEIWKDVN